MSRRHSDVLLELGHIRQDDPLLRRRCFTGGGIQLNTWEESNGKLARFRVSHESVALTWDKPSGLKSYMIDDGEASGVGYKSSSLLLNLRRVDFQPLSEALGLALGHAPETPGKHLANLVHELLRAKLELDQR